MLEKGKDVGTPLGWSMSHEEGYWHGPTVFGFTLLRLTCQKLANLNKNKQNKKFCLLINNKSPTKIFQVFIKHPQGSKRSFL